MCWSPTWPATSRPSPAPESRDERPGPVPGPALRARPAPRAGATVVHGRQAVTHGPIGTLFIT